MKINDAIKAAHETACNKGWWDSPAEIGTSIALMHSELSEALEAARVGDPPSDKVPEISSVEEELADLVIRVFDFCGYHGIDLERAIERKMAYNKTRTKKHGGKLF